MAKEKAIEVFFFFSIAYDIKKFTKREGDWAVEASLARIVRTRSSGKESNKSGPAEIFSGETLCRFRAKVLSPVKLFRLFGKSLISDEEEEEEHIL